MLHELSGEELDTYSRQIALRDIGLRGQERIRRARVCVIGVGGLGSTIVTQLAGMGVGLLRIVDRDLVERTNLHRQSVYSVDHLGAPKVEAAESRIRKINPDVKVEALPLSVNKHNVEHVVEGMDIVLDGLDSLAARRIVNRACVKQGKPYVFGAAVEMFGNASTIIPGETPCLDCFLPRREPSATCATIGVHPSLVSTVASIQVSEAVKIITGAKPSLAGRLLFIDLRNLFFETISINRSDSCETCSGKQPPCFEEEENGFNVEETRVTWGKPYFTVSPNPLFELDFSRLPAESGWLKIKTASRLAAVLLLHNTIEICLLKYGVGIVRGARDKADALQAYIEALSLFNRRSISGFD
ncbi:MAG: HesA/MoeB/ThiF family protein [Thermoproteota archaeon]